MPQTNRMNLRYPAGTDTPDVVRDMGSLAADLEAVLPRILGTSLQAGVIGLNDLKVSAGAGMTVNVAAGVATVPDQTDTYPALTPVFRAALNGLAVTAANGTNPRLDQVLIDPDGTLSVLAGTPTSGATLDNRSGAAVIPNGYLRIADVLIPAASASVSAGNIRDRRSWARGALGRYSLGTTTNTSSDFDYGSAFRLECSGAPLDVSINGQVGANNGAYMGIQLKVDGVVDTNPSSGVVYVPDSAQAYKYSHTANPTVAAGSHLFQARGTGTGTARIIYAATIIVRERIGVNVDQT